MISFKRKFCKKCYYKNRNHYGVCLDCKDTIYIQFVKSHLKLYKQYLRKTRRKPPLLFVKEISE